MNQESRIKNQEFYCHCDPHPPSFLKGGGWGEAILSNIKSKVKIQKSKVQVKS